MSENPEDRKPDLSSFPRGAISIKGLPVSRNARLPSIRIPRDLTLGAQPKRTFKPNIPVRREKRAAEPKLDTQPNTSSASKQQGKPGKHERGRGKGKGRGRELIQMEGGLFEMGIATVANDKSKEASLSRSGFSAGRSSSGKKKSVAKTFDACQDMDTLLRDDFIDDGSDEDEKEDSCPVMYPYVEKEKSETDKKVKKEPFNQDFNDENFAKDLGFDVQKISKFIKKEKSDDEIVEKPKAKEIPNLPENDIAKLFTNENELFVIKVPQCLPICSQDQQSNSQSTSEPSIGKGTNSLATAPEGKIGKIQILKSGSARLLVGSQTFQLDYVKNLPTEHKIHSIITDTDPGEIILLNNANYLLNISPNVHDIIGNLTLLDIRRDGNRTGK